MSLFFKDSGHIYRARPFSAFDEWLEHGFGTRLTTAWRGEPLLAWVRQIHSDICLVADGRAGCLGEGDALMTGAPGVLLSVRTADCVPVLVADPRRRAAAAVHAGWRGTALGVAAKTVAAMEKTMGSRPGDLHVAIGPAVGACCYEVGPEVACQFRELFPERVDLGGRAHIDLAEANRRQLLRSGVAAERIYMAGLCTSCCAGEFYSWRRDGRKAGRMLSAVRIRY